MSETYPLLALSRHRLGIDGVGVTTLVAGAGCPLSCRWCINEKLLHRGKVTPVTVQALYDMVRCDDLYFRATGGGVTFGGGEALLHAAFYEQFRRLCPDWRLCAETSLAVQPELVCRSAAVIDDFIVDCKDMNPETYHAYTGGDGTLMRENLEYLLRLIGPERITVRVPLIPAYNTAEDQAKSAEALRAMGITQLNLFKYVLRK